MNAETMASAALSRVAMHINRSAGQHSRAMRESSLDAFSESMGEASAQRQIDGDKAAIIRDVICELCSLGASKKRTDTLAAQLCSVAGIDINLLNEG
jgi:hypothetical protein